MVVEIITRIRDQVLEDRFGLWEKNFKGKVPNAEAGDFLISVGIVDAYNFEWARVEKLVPASLLERPYPSLEIAGILEFLRNLQRDEVWYDLEVIP